MALSATTLSSSSLQLINVSRRFVSAAPFSLDSIFHLRRRVKRPLASYRGSQKVSKRAKKASRRVLPAAMSPRLVSFAVDGILLLGSLSITRAFLEVICGLGGTVFTVILLIRLFWTGASFFQNYGDSFGPNPL
ncbi:hypothetical protein IGI04_028564 [Brassica rapa subsp. trilocularis]|uniref:Uncharacterized protein n=1 Tax=Brassica rapa subsp. trilocularis TaxID=1813537 RepID=A0ABQ7L2A2_BRACM|nr:hypothetical protein IGI04_028564 [Brassica rapa subsp. trilocularis]